MPVVRISEELFREIQKYAEPLVDNFESALWKVLEIPKAKQPITRERTTPIVRGDVTPQKMFWTPVLKSLVEQGGEAPAGKVVEQVEIKMKNQLKRGDYEPNRDGFFKWKKGVHFQRLAMVHEGLLANNTPRGIWRITEQGRRWLETNRDL